jgi:hypothetical protein
MAEKTAWAEIATSKTPGAQATPGGFVVRGAAGCRRSRAESLWDCRADLLAEKVFRRTEEVRLVIRARQVEADQQRKQRERQ